MDQYKIVKNKEERLKDYEKFPKLLTDLYPKEQVEKSLDYNK